MGILGSIFGGEPSPQERWDDQIEMNRSPVLGLFPSKTAEELADRRNGGDGFDTGDGTWTDHR